MRPQDNGRVRKEIIRFGLHFHLRENVGLWPPVLQLLCQQPCLTDACKNQIELVQLPCGHPLKGDCNLRNAGIFSFSSFHSH